MCLKTMLAEKCGYRNEEFQGSGERLAQDVIRFELNDLGNRDILYTMTEMYGVDFSSFFEDEEIFDEVSENILDVMEIILCFLEKKLQTTRDNIHVLWLASKETVMDMYYGTEENVQKYEIGDDWIVISNLGYDGILFAFKK